MRKKFNWFSLVDSFTGQQLAYLNVELCAKHPFVMFGSCNTMSLKSWYWNFPPQTFHSVQIKIRHSALLLFVILSIIQSFQVIAHICIKVETNPQKWFLVFQTFYQKSLQAAVWALFLLCTIIILLVRVVYAGTFIILWNSKNRKPEIASGLFRNIIDRSLFEAMDEIWKQQFTPAFLPL